MFKPSELRIGSLCEDSVSKNVLKVFEILFDEKRNHHVVHFEKITEEVLEKLECSI